MCSKKTIHITRFGCNVTKCLTSGIYSGTVPSKNKWTEGAELFKHLCKLYVVTGDKRSDKGKDIYTDITACLRRLAGLDNNMHACSELTHNIYRHCELWLGKRGSVNDAERPVESWVC